MISSFLDTDLYKFTMMLFAYENFRDLEVEYAFKCRTKVDLHPYSDEIEREIYYKYCNLSFKNKEVQYLVNEIDPRFKFLDKYVNTSFLDPTCITINKIENGELSIRVKGKWWKTILFEVPVLAIVNEVYSKATGLDMFKILASGVDILKDKIELIRGSELKIMEFGTRRRFSRDWQEMVLKTLVAEVPDNIIGTSNIKLAMDMGIPCLGSQAHEYLQIFQGVFHPVKSQYNAFKAWNLFWGDKYSIALTDIFPTKKFIKDFTKDIAEEYKGLRHDSDCPFKWTREMLKMYEEYGIDPKTKTLIYSDGLDIEKCHQLFGEFYDKTNVVFGIGTNLTNDMGEGHKALQVVMKIVTVDGLPVAKISNNIAKSMCEDKVYLNALIHLIDEDIKNV